MKKILFSVILFLCSGVQAQELFTEVQARVKAEEPVYTFRVLGDREATTFSAYGIHVIAPDGSEQMLDQFDALLPEGSEADALYVEDVNFDGYSDLRIMKYLPGGANVPYYFWLYDPETNQFKESKAFEVVLSPQVDHTAKVLISQQRSSAAEYVRKFYKPRGPLPTLVRREERKFSPDGSSVLKIFKIGPDNEQELIETKQLGPET